MCEEYDGCPVCCRGAGIEKAGKSVNNLLIFAVFVVS